MARLFLYKSGDESDDELVHGIGAMSLRVAAAEVAAAPEVAMHALLRVRLSPAAAKRFNRRLDKLVDDVQAAETPDGEPLGPRGRPLPVASSLMRLPGGLWRHRDFRNLWAAETISQFGSQIDDLALGLVAIIVLEASAFEVAVYGTLNFLPFILFTLPAGVWVDRRRESRSSSSATWGASRCS